jgi:predicted TIM-barrel fold metal-dependent hydrolase
MRGLKLHFGNSGVSLRNPETVTRMREVFALANRLRAAIIVHMRARSGTPYGGEDATLFIEQLLPVAPDITVQVAHLAGAGPGFGVDAEEAMKVFGAAIVRGDERMRRVLFDATTVFSPEGTPKDGEAVAVRIREVGIDRIVFGSDLPIGSNPRLADAWELFRAKVPLTSAEFARIASNVAPYLR